MSRRCAVACVLLLGAAAAGASRGRVRWKGVTTHGASPARLSDAVEAHLAVALRQLGLRLTGSAAAIAEASATCELSSPGEPAHCRVDVQEVPHGRHAQRQADIPFTDAQDLAESLSLLVSDALVSDLGAGLAGSAPPAEDEPEPEPEPAPELVSPPPPAPTPEGERPAWVVSAAAHETLDLGGGPNLSGGGVRALRRVTGPLVIGVNGAASAGRYHAAFTDLDFVRAELSVRVGLGYLGPRFFADLCAGTGVTWLLAAAHAAGSHSYFTAHGVLGGHAGVRIVSALAVELGADVAGLLDNLAVQTAAGQPITSVSQVGVTLTAGLAGVF